MSEWVNQYSESISIHLTYLGVEEDHSDVGKDVGHHGVLEEVETVMKKVKFRFTYNIIIKK